MQWRCFSRSPLIRVSATGSLKPELDQEWAAPVFFSFTLSHRAERNWTKITSVCNAHRHRARGRPPPSFWLYYGDVSLWIRIPRGGHAEKLHRAGLCRVKGKLTSTQLIYKVPEMCVTPKRFCTDYIIWKVFHWFLKVKACTFNQLNNAVLNEHSNNNIIINITDMYLDIL